MSLIPKNLEQSLREGRVIPFAGAGVSMSVRESANGRPIFPSWGELLLRAAERLEHESRGETAAEIRGLLGEADVDYAEVARRAKSSLGGIWYDLLRETFSPPRSRVCSDSLILARLLWRLGSKLVITTNYDRVLQWACPREYREDLTVWDIQAAVEQRTLLRQGPPNPTIWHLHGQIDQAANIILTPESYTRLYADGGEAQGQQPSPYEAALFTLRSLLASYTFVFVGFSLNDPYFGSQLNWIDRVFAGSTGHYALVSRSDFERSSRQLPVQLIPFEGFGRPLLTILGRLKKVAREAAREREFTRRAAEAMREREPELIKSILELMAIAKGYDSYVAGKLDEIIRNLQSGLSGGPGGLGLEGCVKELEAAAEVTHHLEGKLSEHAALLESKRKELQDQVGAALAKLDALVKPKEELYALVGRHLEQTVQSVTGSLGGMIDEIPDKIKWTLARRDLAPAGFWGRVRVKRMSEEAASISERIIREEFESWQRRCFKEILPVKLSALQDEVDRRLQYAIREAVDDYGRSLLPVRYLIEDLPDRIAFELPDHVRVFYLNDVLEDFSFATLLFMILAALMKLDLSNNLEQKVKVKTVAVVRAHLDGSKRAVVRRVESRIKELLEPIKERARERMDASIKEVTDQLNGMRDYVRSAEAEVAESLNKIAHSYRRVAELRQELTRSLDEVRDYQRQLAPTREKL